MPLGVGTTADRGNAGALERTIADRGNAGAMARTTADGGNAGAIAPTIADMVLAHGLSAEEMRALPLLSDEGMALQSYGSCHAKHYYCFRHLLEGLGSGTLVAMLARRLLFTRTEFEFLELIGQTLSDFRLACTTSLITSKAQKKFRRMFGIPAAPAPASEVDIDLVRLHALWGKRGIEDGVASCTNHIEGLHGRLNATTANLRNPARRLSMIIQRIRLSAAHWAVRVEKARAKIVKELTPVDEGKERVDQCESPRCDKGSILSQRYEMELPCRHMNPLKPSSSMKPVQFDLTDEREPTFSVRDAAGDERVWSFSSSHRPSGKLPDEEHEPPPGDEIQRFIARIRHELRYIAHGKEFPYHRDKMLFRLGQIYGGGDLTRSEMETAQSAFLIECIEVLQNKRSW
jgi:hypothetical protein